MVEKTERGRQARRYFIECERVAKQAILDERARATVALYLAEEMRPWAKTFPDELWTELARLTGREVTGSRRPQFWGRLVNEFVYGLLDEDVLAWLRENAQKSKPGHRYHQHFNPGFGLKRLTEHLWLVIGTARQSFSIGDLRNRLELQAGRSAQLSLLAPAPRLRRSMGVTAHG